MSKLKVEDHTHVVGPRCAHKRIEKKHADEHPPKGSIHSACNGEIDGLVLLSLFFGRFRSSNRRLTGSDQTLVLPSDKKREDQPHDYQ